MKTLAPENPKFLLNQLRKLGMKQEEIAERLETSQSTISRWAHHSDTINYEAYFRIVNLAREMGILDNLPTKITNQANNNLKGLIAEIDVFAGAGGGGLAALDVSSSNGITFSKEAVRAQWEIPDWVLSRISARPEHIVCLPVRGDSMEPTIMEGDVIFVDTRQRLPSPPGIFATEDQWGEILVKRIEVISKPNEEDVRVKVIFDNSRYEAREYIGEELNIIGRVVGRFTF